MASILQKLKIHLLLDQPFFGSSLMRLHERAEDGIDTIKTDGTYLTYDPAFLAKFSHSEQLAIVAHETLHCCLRHPYRRGGRDPELWNIACDYVVNALLRDSKFTLPAGALLDGQYDNMTAEQVYSKLAQSGGGGSGSGNSGGQQQPSPTGSFDDADSGEEQAQTDGVEPNTDQDWQIATEQAMNAAKKAGKDPAGLRRQITQVREGSVDWRAILRRFIQETAPADYTWQRPNKRYISQGLYLPGVKKEQVPPFAIGIDTSGSITAEMLDVFAAEVSSIMHEMRPERIEVVYCDAAVNRHDTYTPDDPEVKLEPCGGGGTAFQPVFDFIDDNDLKPACAIYFTDLYGDNPVEPEYPVLWIVPEHSSVPPPFGELVHLSMFR